MASTTQKLDTTYYDETGNRLNSTSFLNLFNILQDIDRSTKFMNIFKSYSINDSVTTDIVFYDSYEVEDNAWWDDISYKIYGTPYLWWTIALFNNIVNPFEELEAGSNIKILRPEYLYTLMRDIEKLKDL